MRKASQPPYLHAANAILIHPSAWKGYSANFALTGFLESPHRFAVGCSSPGTFSGRFSELWAARD